MSMLAEISTDAVDIVSTAVKSSNTPSLELVLSVLAIIISVVVAIVEYVWNKWINTTNLEAEFYKDIYFEYLMKTIPEARQEIRYNNKKIEDIDKFTNVLNDMRRDSLFFRYKDKAFYDKLKNQLQSLEDYVTQVSSKDEVDAEEFSTFTSKMSEQIEQIYDSIMKRYKGRK